MVSLSNIQVLPKWVRNAVIGRRPKWTIIRVAVLVALVGLLRLFVFVQVRVEGISMEPTFHNNSINLIYMLAYKFAKPQRGDVVGVRYAGSKVLLLKRVVALPGETLAFIEGRLYIDGKLLLEPYVKYKCDWDMPPRTLGSNDYFVVGDNRSMPFMNHTKGAYQLEDIIGRALFGGRGNPTLGTN